MTQIFSRAFFISSVFLICSSCWAQTVSVYPEKDFQKIFNTLKSTHSLNQPKGVYQFYKSKDFQTQWSKNGQPLPPLFELKSLLQNSFKDGLNNSTYHLTTIDTLLNTITQLNSQKKPIPNQICIQLDLLLTDSALALANELYYGRYPPENSKIIVKFKKQKLDMVTLLSQALNQHQVSTLFQSLAPPYSGYQHLKQKRAELVAIQEKGGWPTQFSNSLKQVKLGYSHPQLPLLFTRLSLSGDLSLTLPIPTSDVYSIPLIEGVKKFQIRHGLEPSGVIDDPTLFWLKKSTSEYLQIIDVNLNRWRWLPISLGDRYILINIPEFKLTFKDKNYPEFSMKVIVGRESRKTPLFNALMSSIVLNPYWNVPRSILVKDIIPDVKKNPNYLSKLNFKVVNIKTNRIFQVNPGAITSYANDSVFRLRQEPGPKNSLGQIKFQIENPYNVYLHDTPKKQLFQEKYRALSSGCIRLEKPIDLFHKVAESETDITPLLETHTEHVVRLKNPLQVYIMYWTAVVNSPTDNIQFYNDLYRMDEL